MFRVLLMVIALVACVLFVAPAPEASACGGLFAGRPLARLGSALRERKPVRTLFSRAARGLGRAAGAVLGR